MKPRIKSAIWIIRKQKIKIKTKTPNQNSTKKKEFLKMRITKGDFGTTSSLPTFVSCAGRRRERIRN